MRAFLSSVWTLWRIARRTRRESITLDESFAREVEEEARR